MHADEPNKINGHFTSLEGKFNSKNLALKAYLLEKIYELKNKMKLLHDKNEKVKPDAGEKDEINLKVEFLVKEKNSLKTEINGKQDLVESILEHNSNLLRRQCCHFKQHPRTDQSNQGVSGNTNKKLVTT